MSSHPRLERQAGFCYRAANTSPSERILLPPLVFSAADLKFWTYYSLNRCGLHRDLCRFVWRRYLKRFVFEQETLWLQGQRFLAQAEFQNRYLHSMLMKCIEFETRLLKMETGDFLIRRGPTTGRWTHDLTPIGLDSLCCHPNFWARVRSPLAVPRYHNWDLLHVIRVPEKRQRTGDENTGTESDHSESD